MAYEEQFILAKTKAGFDAGVAAGNIQDESVVLISESGEEAIHAQGKTLQAVPSNGSKGQVLTFDGTRGRWAEINYRDLVSYGVAWKPNVADPNLERVGSLSYHRSLPIQSGMKGCIYNPKEKKVVYWLDEDNWNYKKGGNPDKGQTEDPARLDGYDGEVMIYVPEFYIKSWDTEDKREVRITDKYIDDTWEHQPAIYLAAYRDTVLNTVPENMGYLSTLEANTAVSVANNQPYCRGGNNNATNDADEDIFKRQLGKCRTYVRRADFRGHARKAGKEIMSYKQYKNVLYWLWVIEYATFNSQAAFNEELTAEGFKQGGMGPGLTNVSNWSSYNNYYPISPNGYTNEFGNGTGVKLIEPLGPAPVGNVYAIRWRGIENPFGDIWHNVDGIIINNASIEKDGVKYSEVYATDDPSLYSDSDYQSMTKVGEEFVGSDGYIKEWDLGSTAEIVPRLNGGNATQYKCDYHYRNTSTGLRTLFLGGNAHNGANAGLGYFGSYDGVGFSGTHVGFRTSCVAE